MTKFREENLELVKPKSSKLVLISKVVLSLLGLIAAGIFLLFLFVFLTMGVPSIG